MQEFIAEHGDLLTFYDQNWATWKSGTATFNNQKLTAIHKNLKEKIIATGLQIEIQDNATVGEMQRVKLGYRGSISPIPVAQTNLVFPFTASVSSSQQSGGSLWRHRRRVAGLERETHCVPLFVKPEFILKSPTTTMVLFGHRERGNRRTLQ